jgi:glycosyltransferase involved in cell wall biosynthesis
VVWQRLLPYHVARLRALDRACRQAGHRLVGVEVAGTDRSYRFPEQDGGGFLLRRCFAQGAYHDYTARQVRARTEEVLREIDADIVFAPATAFPEGMAALSWRRRAGRRSVLMDDAWEGSDQRSWPTRVAKRILHRGVDAAFVPAPSHHPYYEGLGFPPDRIVDGVDVVDNDFFASTAEEARGREGELRGRLGLPGSYFLFVGRPVLRKGLDTLLEAYRAFRLGAGDRAPGLVVVGPGDGRGGGEAAGVRFAGAHFGKELGFLYGLADILVVPSRRDPWALVVNEGMAAGLPVIVSRGCGSARTLVREGENGWTFEPGDAPGLAALLSRGAALGRGRLAAMGARSREIAASWTLDRFTAGVFSALAIPRREPAGLLTDLLIAGWHGRVRID